MYLNYNYFILLSFLISLFIVYISIPSIVNVAHLKQLYDMPDLRKSHHQSIPNLGGVAIFAAISIASGLFVDISRSTELLPLMAAMVVIFFIGIKDDILVIAPDKKLYGQIIAAVIIVFAGNMRLTDLHGFFGIHHINYYASVALTMFVIVVLVNAFNLIDGIDGLASGIGMVVTLTFGIWFYLTDYINYAIVAAAVLGALTGFFGFNVFGTKNKIFMGDTGSLILGLIISVFVIKFNEANISGHSLFSIKAAPAVSFGILIIPLFDTLRVFILRIVRGRSPFDPDKNHLHHRVIQLGFSHAGATFLISFVNILFIAIVFTFQSVGLMTLMAVNLLLASLFSAVIEFMLRRIGIQNNLFVPPASQKIKIKLKGSTSTERNLHSIPSKPKSRVS